MAENFNTKIPRRLHTSKCRLGVTKKKKTRGNNNRDNDSIIGIKKGSRQPGGHVYHVVLRVRRVYDGRWFHAAESETIGRRFRRRTIAAEIFFRVYARKKLKRKKKKKMPQEESIIGDDDNNNNTR